MHTLRDFPCNLETVDILREELFYICSYQLFLHTTHRKIAKIDEELTKRLAQACLSEIPINSSL